MGTWLWPNICHPPQSSSMVYMSDLEIFCLLSLSILRFSYERRSRKKRKQARCYFRSVKLHSYSRLCTFSSGPPVIRLETQTHNYTAVTLTVEEVWRERRIVPNGSTDVIVKSLAIMVGWKCKRCVKNAGVKAANLGLRWNYSLTVMLLLQTLKGTQGK